MGEIELRRDGDKVYEANIKEDSALIVTSIFYN